MVTSPSYLLSHGTHRGTTNATNKACCRRPSCFTKCKQYSARPAVERRANYSRLRRCHNVLLVFSLFAMNKPELSLAGSQVSASYSVFPDDIRVPFQKRRFLGIPEGLFQFTTSNFLFFFLSSADLSHSNRCKCGIPHGINARN